LTEGNERSHRSAPRVAVVLVVVAAVIGACATDADRAARSTTTT
jgi:hypothetical protein